MVQFYEVWAAPRAICRGRNFFFSAGPKRRSSGLLKLKFNYTTIRQLNSRRSYFMVPFSTTPKARSSGFGIGVGCERHPNPVQLVDFPLIYPRSSIILCSFSSLPTHGWHPFQPEQWDPHPILSFRTNISLPRGPGSV